MEADKVEKVTTSGAELNFEAPPTTAAPPTDEAKSTNGDQMVVETPVKEEPSAVNNGEATTANTDQYDPMTVDQGTTASSTTEAPAASSETTNGVSVPNKNTKPMSPTGAERPLSPPPSEPKATAKTTALAAATTPPTDAPATAPEPDDLKKELQRFTNITPEKIDALDGQIAADQYDTEAWKAIIQLAQRQPIDNARPIYERFLSIFPTAGKYWKYYAEHEIQSKNYPAVERIFKRCLLQCPNIELWKCYISYLRLIKEKDSKETKEARDEICRGYEFALEHMGMDIESTQLWVDYLAYLKDQKTNNTFEDSQKMTSVRKLYQRTVENPMIGLEPIWKEYDAYENSLNKLLAKSLLTELSPKYMAARAVYRERKTYYDGIQRNMIARPPVPGKKDNQVLLWKKLLAFEKTNPQRIGDPNLLRQRITFTYNQCLTCLYHYPEIWYEAACYQMEFGNSKPVFERALVALPNCSLLYFAYADYLESLKEIEEAKSVYERLIEKFGGKPDALVWIQFMRFERRTSGVDGARKVFMRARKSGCSYHVFVASATLEFQVNKDQNVARNIFELGTQKFLDEPAFIAQYINFLYHVNEENNMRGLFERVLSNKNLPVEKSKDLWEMYLQFEYSSCSDMTRVLQLEKRRAQLFPDLETTGIFSLLQRYHQLDLWPCSSADMFAFEGPVTIQEHEKRGPPPKSERSQPAHITAAQLAHEKASKFPKPNINAMIPFKSEMALLQPLNQDQGSNNAPQPPTQITIPDVISQLINQLPSPGSYQGPFVDVEQLVTLIVEANLTLPTTAPPQPVTTAPSKSTPSESAKRKKGQESDSDGEEDEAIAKKHKPPSHDIYRKRQATNLKKLNT